MKLIISFLLLVFFNTVQLSAQQEVDGFVKKMKNAKFEYEGFPPVPFQAPDINGENHFLSDYKGQILIIQFWQLYCEPCRSQIPSINKILKDYEDQSVAAIGFVDDFGDELELYANNMAINYPVIPNSRDFAMQAYGGELGYPRVFIIDKYGLIRKLVIGGSSDDDMDLYKEIKPLIENLLKE